MCTTSDVTRLFWPRQDGRQFWARLAEFKGLEESFPRSVGPKNLTALVSMVQTYNVKISHTKISFQWHFNHQSCSSILLLRQLKVLPYSLKISQSAITF